MASSWLLSSFGLISEMNKYQSTQIDNDTPPRSEWRRSEQLMSTNSDMNQRLTSVMKRPDIQQCAGSAEPPARWRLCKSSQTCAPAPSWVTRAPLGVSICDARRVVDR